MKLSWVWFRRTFIAVSIIVCFAIMMNLIPNREYQSQAFFYDSIRDSIVLPAIVIADLDDFDAYQNYYRQLEMGEEPSFDFPLITISTNRKHCVIKYIDSLGLFMLYIPPDDNYLTTDDLNVYVLEKLLQDTGTTAVDLNPLF